MEVGVVVNVGVVVGVKVGVEVGIGVSVKVGEGVMVGPNNCPGPQAERSRLNKEQMVSSWKFLFMILLRFNGRPRVKIVRVSISYTLHGHKLRFLKELKAQGE